MFFILAHFYTLTLMLFLHKLFVVYTLGTANSLKIVITQLLLFKVRWLVLKPFFLFLPVW